MREHPMVFPDEMVQAVMFGMKTQVRTLHESVPEGRLHLMEVVNAQGFVSFRRPVGDPLLAEARVRGLRVRSVREGLLENCIYGVGDHIWVQEAWSPAASSLPNRAALAFRAGFSPPKLQGKWRKAHTLRKQHSRIRLEVTGVRVEHLQDITLADAAAEGIWQKAHHVGSEYAGPGYPGRPGWFTNAGCLRGGFGKFWDARHPEHTWAHNPVVCVLEFKVLEAPVLFPEPDPARFLKALDQALSEDHHCVVTAVLEPPKKSGHLGFYTVRVAYQSELLGPGETLLVCSGLGAGLVEALNVKPGFQFTMKAPLVQ